MLNRAMFTVETYAGHHVPASLLKQYGQLRYQCFDTDDPYVRMDHQNGLELDHFDKRPTTIYIMVICHQSGLSDKLISAVRLIPTTEPYDLEQPSWSYLTDYFPLPKSTKVLEGSRWVGKSSRTPEGTLSTALLMLQIYQLAQRHGVEQLIGVIASKGQNWLQKRKTKADPSSVRHQTERDGEILISTINIDADFLASAKMMMLESMEYWSATHTHFAVADSA
jgi:N-acyl-L-homoserine lactone synthetase